MTSSQSEDRHLDSSYTEEEGTLEGISPRLPGTRTGVLGFPVWWADLTSFMDPNLGMLQHFPSPTYQHAQTSQKHFKLILLVVFFFFFQDFFIWMLVPKLLCASSRPWGSNARGATRWQCWLQAPGSPSPLAPAGSSGPASLPQKAEIRKGYLSLHRNLSIVTKAFPETHGWVGTLFPGDFKACFWPHTLSLLFLAEI